jgi:hypothetical protein
LLASSISPTEPFFSPAPLPFNFVLLNIEPANFQKTLLPPCFDAQIAPTASVVATGSWNSRGKLRHQIHLLLACH